MSFDILADKISTLKKYFPESLTEGKIDFDKLKITLGETVESNDERYTLNWAGRTDTFKNIQMQSIGTLVPDKKESINFDDTKNIFIEGENLEVLKLLQKSYFGKIKCIYIDPPYNTGKDFIYKDNFHESTKSYLEQTGQSNDGVTLTTNPDTAGRFHSNWLSFMYARLFVASNLLTDDGVIFVSIDDNEVYNLKLIMDEIFSEECFIACIVVNVNRSGRRYKEIAVNQEYILCYGNNKDVTINQIPKDNTNLKFEDKKGKYDLVELRNRNPKFTRANRPNLYYPIYVNSKITNKYNECVVSLKKTKDMLEIFPKNSKNEDDCWRWSKKKLEENITDSSITSEVIARQRRDGGWNIYKKDRNTTTKIKSIWDETEVRTENGTIQLNHIFGKDIFSHPKPIELILKCIRISSTSESTILDFFAGSGTTAHAVMELNNQDGGNRKFICVQIPEKNEQESNNEYLTIADICKERIRRAIKQIKQKKSNAKSDLGFKVFKLAKSNYKIWENYNGKDEKVLKEQIKLFESPLIEKYKDEDVIYECIIKEGYDLNSTIEKMNIPSNIIYKVTDGDKSFYICLDKIIQKDIITETKITANDILICMDSALNNSQKTNLSKQCDFRAL